MEPVVIKQFTWINFGMAALLLFLVFLLLQFLHRIVGRALFLGRYQFPLKAGIHRLLLVYEPLVLFILTGIFVFINPALHGFLFLILLLGGFYQLRDYVSGRLVLGTRGLSTGKKLKTNHLQGIITNVGRLGLELQTTDGLHFIPYRQLTARGYTLVSGQEIGGFHQIVLQPKDKDLKKDHVNHLMNLMATTPYVDINYRPELVAVAAPDPTIKARILLKEESHLPQLLALIDDWGYDGQVTNLV